MKKNHKEDGLVTSLTLWRRDFYKITRFSRSQIYFLIYKINFFAIILLFIQGYPQRMRLQRRLYGIYTVCPLIFIILCNCKLVCFFAKSVYKTLQDYIQGRKVNLTMGLSYYLRSSLQSHSLWETLYTNGKFLFLHKAIEQKGLILRASR